MSRMYVSLLQSYSFPGSGSSGWSVAASPPLPPLSSFAPHVQQTVLLRELLLALTGVHGQFIKVAANTTTASASATATADSSTSMSSPSSKRPIQLLVDEEHIDRATASQVSQSVSHMFSFAKHVYIYKYLQS